MCRRKIMVCTAHANAEETLNFAMQHFDSTDCLFSWYHLKEAVAGDYKSQKATKLALPLHDTLLSGRGMQGGFPNSLPTFQKSLVRDSPEELSTDSLLETTLYADLLIIAEPLYNIPVTYRGRQTILCCLLQRAHCPVITVPNQCQPLQNMIFVYDQQPASFSFIKKILVDFPDLCNTLAITLLYIQSDSIAPISKQQEKAVIAYMKFHCANLGMHKVYDSSGLLAARLLDEQSLWAIPPSMNTLPPFLNCELQKAQVSRLFVIKL